MLTALEPVVNKSSATVLNDRGRLIYSGQPHLFADWTRRVRLRFRRNRVQPDPKTDEAILYEIAEDLRGTPADAFHAALDEERIISALDDGVQGEDLIISIVRDKLFPNKAQNAIHIYQLGHTKGGTLSRALGESMHDYIERRALWYVMLQDMAPGNSISEEIRTEYLLREARLTDLQQKLVRTTVRDVILWDLVKEALLAQYYDVHKTEKGFKRSERSSSSRTSTGGRGKGKSSYRFGKGRGFKRRAFHASSLEGEESEEVIEYSDEYDEPSGVAMHSMNDDHIYEDQSSSSV